MWRAALVLVLVLPLARADTLALLSKKWIETGLPADREALSRFAAEQSAQPEGAAARFVLGFRDYRDKNLASAVEQLALASQGRTEIADYAVFYHALTLAADGAHAEAARLLADFGKRFQTSPLVGAALRQRADSLSLAGQASEALKLLPGAPSTASEWMLVAQVADRAGELMRAAQSYQRVYYEFPSSPEQSQASSALGVLRAKLGPRYPEATSAMRLGRADKLFDARSYSTARLEYRGLSQRLRGLPREQAAVRIGACDYHLRATTRGYQWLKTLKPAQAEAAAERLYYLAACARRLNREGEFVNFVEQLGREHRASPWYEEALFSAGNAFLVENADERYVTYYRKVYEAFPRGRYAALAHWKVAWRKYVEQSPGAARLFEEHIRLYPSSVQLTAAIYWLGRVAEAGDNPATARAAYEYLTGIYPNYYHTLLARERLKTLPQAKAPAPAAIVRLLAATPPPVTPPPPEPSPEWAPAQRRARLLARLGLAELADRELRFRAESPLLAYPAGLELAKQAADRGDFHQSIRYLKRYTPGYLAYPLESMPREYWELLYPLPWREQIEGYSKLQELDPYLVAALIRQESEFNPGAISPARARGLMQIMPSTGRLLGRQLGLPTVTPNRLLVPETSLKLGTLHLRRVLDQYAGRIEAALAGYNAGERRADKWLDWHATPDPDVFIESIPFTETRAYVQAVLRNVDMYRKLY